MPLRLGTRSSRLAIWQANWVASLLHRLDVSVDIVPLTTDGDADDRPIGQMGTTGVFTKAIQQALLDDQIDLAVHSLKDLPTQPTPGLSLAAVLDRESPLDCLVTEHAGGLQGLPEGARVGTGSLRRQAQLLHARPDLRVEPIRGNVETRLARLDAGQFDGLILAEAGLLRLAKRERIAETLDVDIMVPAPGQGALAIETRTDDAKRMQAAARLEDAVSRTATDAERIVMRMLGGGCDAPLGAYAEPITPGHFRLTAVVLSRDGQHCLRETGEYAEDAVRDGARSISQRLLEQGAATLLQ